MLLYITHKATSIATNITNIPSTVDAALNHLKQPFSNALKPTFSNLIIVNVKYAYLDLGSLFISP